MSSDNGSEGLGPIPASDREMGLKTYIPVWWASLIVVQAFAVAFFAVYPQGQLNLFQAALACLIGATLVTGFFILNGFPGYEEGIPYAVQTRSAFGARGSIIPNFVRIIPAIAWFGVGNWIGAQAILTITDTLFGFGNIWVYFFLFLLLNLALAWGGVTSIEWFDSIAAGVIIILLAYTVYIVLTTEGIPQDVLSYGGSWGMQFVTVIAASVGVIITGALNASDLSRHLEQSDGAGNHVVGASVGILPPLLFMLLVGITFGVSTGNPNPIAAIMAVAPTPILGTMMLVFIIGAQISTNLTLNILPPTHVFQDTLGVSWKQGVLITGVLSVVTFPWVLFSSQWFFTFINFYSAFLGPALGILIADYWIVQARFSDVDALYDKSEDSRFWYVSGVSPSAILALFIGAGASMPVLSLSWMVGLPVGIVTYVIFRRIDLDGYITGAPTVTEPAD